MTTDTTELVQMKGQKVEGSYYLAECTDCGKMYPSNKLNGGEPLFSGDYGECYCPHCNADDAAIGDCGDTAATAWNYQQNHIDALVEALEKAQQRIASQREYYEGVIADGGKRIAELESRTVTVKLPELIVDKVCLTAAEIHAQGSGVNDDKAQEIIDRIREILTPAAGIKWEVE